MWLHVIHESNNYGWSCNNLGVVEDPIKCLFCNNVTYAKERDSCEHRVTRAFKCNMHILLYCWDVILVEPFGFIKVGSSQTFHLRFKQHEWNKYVAWKGRLKKAWKVKFLDAHSIFCIANTVWSFFLGQIIFNFFEYIKECTTTYLHVFWKLIYATNIPPEKYHVPITKVRLTLYIIVLTYKLINSTYEPLNCFCEGFEFFMCAISIIYIV